MADIQDYWTGSGYSQIPDSGVPEGYRAFDESKALGVDHGLGTSFESYAPWAGGPTQDLDYGEINPWSQGGTAPSGRGSSPNEWASAGAGFGGGAAGALGAYGLGAGTGGAATMGFAGALAPGGAMLGPLGLAGAGLAYGLNKAGVFDKKKKRGNTEFRAPSYQGQQFTPEEGFPSYYETAQGVDSPGMLQQEQQMNNEFQYQAPQQQGYDYNYTGGVAQPSAGLSQQGYVGQQEQEYGSFYNQDQGGIFDTFTV